MGPLPKTIGRGLTRAGDFELTIHHVDGNRVQASMIGPGIRDGYTGTIEGTTLFFEGQNTKTLLTIEGDTMSGVRTHKSAGGEYRITLRKRSP
jgi:hypothetical protein